MISTDAVWIWPDIDPQPDEYAIFETHFSYGGGTAELKIAAETDYIAYLNGEVVGFGQFAGWPTEKYYDTLDLTAICRMGENTLTLTVRYEGCNSASRIEDGAGVIFAVTEDGICRAHSGLHTRCGLDGRYIQHQARILTVQLGYSSGMQAPRPHMWLECCTVERTCRLLPRPVEKTVMQAPVKGVPLAENGCIFDLGDEYAGYLMLSVTAKQPCRVKLAYAEHLTDGVVQYRLGDRDFSLDFDCNAGENCFTQYFIRVAARYVQVLCDAPLTDCAVTMLPFLYPLTEQPLNLTGLDRSIYDACLRTLRLCINQHYEDCPWREQALYVLDSRNQMLCGYYALRETALQRAMLVFISKGLREEGLLELTYPAVDTPAIPFFSVMYPVAVWEYIQHTGDDTIIDEVMPTMETIMTTLLNQMDTNRLLSNFPAPFWNFYEWSKGNDGIKNNVFFNPVEQYDLILNCAFVYAAEKFKALCGAVSTTFACDTDSVKTAIQEHFYQAETGLFCTDTNQPAHSSQLGNAFALLIGLGDERTADALKDENLPPATLSMLGFVYDALLAADPANKEFVLEDIRKKYGMMLATGSTTVWETIGGVDDFDSAASLCHGWSAMPIYYYHLLLKN